MPNDDRLLDSKHGISRDLIAYRLEIIEKSFADFAKEMRDEIKELHNSFALASKGCPMAGQCENIVADVKKLQEERHKTRGILISVGVVCTFVGWVLSTLPAWLK